jgi:hypothetical protein
VKNHCTINLLFDWFGISCMTTDNFCFYLQNRLIQTSQTGGQRYSHTSPFSIPYSDSFPALLKIRRVSKSRVYIGEGSSRMLVTMTHDSDTLILALATLGRASEIEMILSVSHRPRWPRQVKCLSLSPISFCKKHHQCTQIKEARNKRVDILKECCKH